MNDEADPWVTPLIRDDNVQDVYTLKVPDPKTNPVFRQAWERIDYLQSHSDLPLRLVNVPSPLVTASLVWEYTSFIAATMLYPREVHVLMEKITGAGDRHGTPGRRLPGRAGGPGPKETR